MTKERIIDRVRRLLELSKSTNEHEASLAAARAAELMLEHQIAEAELEADVAEPEPITEEAIDGDARRVQWKLCLVDGLATSLGGYCYFQTGNWTPGGRAPTTYQVVGTPSVIATVRYMYAYLVKEVNRLADEAYRREAMEREKSLMPAPPAAPWKGSFRIGCATAIEQRLVAQRAKTHRQAKLENKEKALAVINREALAVRAFVKQHHPKMRRVSSSAGNSSAGIGGYGSGLAAGSSVNLGGGKALGAGAKRLGGGK